LNVSNSICNKNLLVLIQNDLIQFEHSNSIRSICTKTNTNLLLTNSIRSISRRNHRGVAGNLYCGGDNGNGEGSGTDKKLADLANVRRKETREDQDDADKRGGQSPVRRSGNSDCGVTRGQ
jgi:hypothetical protein